MSKPTKHILVTGGLGFIGFHLCSEIKRRDPSAALTIVDNLSSTQINPTLLQALGDIHRIDLNQFDASNQKFDEIYHLASPVGSLGILESNGYVAHSISKLAMKAADIACNSSAKLLYLSSSEVYGRDGQHAEDIELRVPSLRGTRMEYALGKLTAEHTLLNRSAQNEFRLRIVRPFNVIGPWQSAEIGFVIPTFFAAAIAGTPLPVFGDGQQKRSFCLVDDLVDGMLAVQSRGVDQTIYNLGNPGNIISVKDLANDIVQLCHSNSSLKLTDPVEVFGTRYLEAFQKLPDIDKATNHTGWTPKADLATALRHCRSFYKTAAQQTSTPSNSLLQGA
ncbi:MAG: NAD-dependent epimerase/dehydratase family protein [Granulosicoccaceae bacterium]